MTEKRFRNGVSILTDFPTGAIIDERTGERYYDGIKPSYISSKELVKILNELYEENQKLKQKVAEQGTQINFLNAENIDFRNKIDSLELENTNLRQWNMCLAEKRHDELEKRYYKYYPKKEGGK